MANLRISEQLLGRVKELLWKMSPLAHATISAIGAISAASATINSDSPKTEFLVNITIVFNNPPCGLL